MEQIYLRPGFLLRRAHQLSVSLFEKYCKKFNITPPQYGILNVLSYTDQLDQTALSKALGHDKVTTLHIVRVMESKGLIKKTKALTGRRRIFISLTEDGRDLLKQVIPATQQVYEHLLSPLNNSEQKMLLHLLERLCSELEDTARAPMIKALPKNQ